MSIYKNGKLIAGGRQCMPLLSFMWADHVLNDASWLRADTFSWHTGSSTKGVYKAAYAHLSADITGKTLQSETISGTTIQFYLADDGHKICPASEESNVSAIYNATGVAWYYIIDTANTRFKLPRTQFAFTGIRNGVGGFVEAGLPNITGSFSTASDKNLGTGAFSWTTDRYSTNGGGSGSQWGINFSAQNSNSIYGNSDTVQPKATEMYLYFYVGNFTQTALENTAGLNAELFNGKADLSTVAHVVTEFQEPTSANNYTWYRKYADGWVEQGGIIQNSVNTYTLPVEMSDTNYYVNVCWDGGKYATFYANDFQVRNLTTTSFYTTASRNGNNVQGRCWEVKGIAAN